MAGSGKIHWRPTGTVGDGSSAPICGQDKARSSFDLMDVTCLRCLRKVAKSGETQASIRRRELPEVFSCLLGIDPRTNLWIAHCLDLDLVTSGKLEDDVWEHLKRVLAVYVEYCFRHDPDALKQRAKPEKWLILEKLKEADQPKPIWSEKIRLHLVSDRSAGAADFWIQGVETDRPFGVSVEKDQ
jgi:hypothetical protein